MGCVGSEGAIDSLASFESAEVDIVEQPCALLLQPPEEWKLGHFLGPKLLAVVLDVVVHAASSEVSVFREYLDEASGTVLKKSCGFPCYFRERSCSSKWCLMVVRKNCLSLSSSKLA